MLPLPSIIGALLLATVRVGRTAGDDDKCLTTGNQLCHFPFTYKNKRYDFCPPYGSGRWCSQHATYEGTWGYCKPTCSSYRLTGIKEVNESVSEDGVCVAYATGSNSLDQHDVCHFPFSYGGETHNYCGSTLWRGRAWCYAEKKLPNGARAWGYCNINQCEKTLDDGITDAGATTSDAGNVATSDATTPDPTPKPVQAVVQTPDPTPQPVQAVVQSAEEEADPTPSTTTPTPQTWTGGSVQVDGGTSTPKGDGSCTLAGSNVRCRQHNSGASCTQPDGGKGQFMKQKMTREKCEEQCRSYPHWCKYYAWTEDSVKGDPGKGWCYVYDKNCKFLDTEGSVGYSLYQCDASLEPPGKTCGKCCDPNACDCVQSECCDPDAQRGQGGTSANDSQNTSTSDGGSVTGSTTDGSATGGTTDGSATGGTTDGSNTGNNEQDTSSNAQPDPTPRPVADPTPAPVRPTPKPVLPTPEPTEKSVPVVTTPVNNNSNNSNNTDREWPEGECKMVRSGVRCRQQNSSARCTEPDGGKGIVFKKQFTRKECQDMCQSQPHWCKYYAWSRRPGESWCYVYEKSCKFLDETGSSWYDLYQCDRNLPSPGQVCANAAEGCCDEDWDANGGTTSGTQFNDPPTPAPVLLARPDPTMRPTYPTKRPTMPTNRPTDLPDPTRRPTLHPVARPATQNSGATGNQSGNQSGGQTNTQSGNQSDGGMEAWVDGKCQKIKEKVRCRQHEGSEANCTTPDGGKGIYFKEPYSFEQCQSTCLKYPGWCKYFSWTPGERWCYVYKNCMFIDYEGSQHYDTYRCDASMPVPGSTCSLRADGRCCGGEEVTGGTVTTSTGTQSNTNTATNTSSQDGTSNQSGNTGGQTATEQTAQSAESEDTTSGQKQSGGTSTTNTGSSQNTSSTNNNSSRNTSKNNTSGGTSNNSSGGTSTSNSGGTQSTTNNNSSRSTSNTGGTTSTTNTGGTTSTSNNRAPTSWTQNNNADGKICGWVKGLSAPCALPFYYQNKWHNDCQPWKGQSWCSYDKRYMGAWGYCEPCPGKG